MVRIRRESAVYQAYCEIMSRVRILVRYTDP